MSLLIAGIQMDDKSNELTRLAIEKPQLMKIFSDVDSDLTEEYAFTYHVLYIFAHAYHMHQRKVVSYSEWTGWLRSNAKDLRKHTAAD